MRIAIRLFLLTLGVTAVSPATTQAQLPLPRAFVELYANVSQGQNADFHLIDSSGAISSEPFVPPTDRVLVVTDVLVTPNVDDGLYGGDVYNVLGGGVERIRLRLHSTQQATLHLPFASGVVFSTQPRVFAWATNPGAMVVRLLGHLRVN